MRFLRRFLRVRRAQPTLNDHLVSVYWRTAADLEPILRKRDKLSDAA
jgi:hypothetical protein